MQQIQDRVACDMDWFILIGYLFIEFIGFYVRVGALGLQFICWLPLFHIISSSRFLSVPAFMSKG